MLREARRRHPSVRLLQADLFASPPFPARSFEVLFCSGIFNLRLGNNDEFIASVLPKLMQLCRGCMVANFLDRRVPYQYPHCFYCDPAQVRDILQPAAREVEIIDGYLDNDFTVVAWARQP
jgi:hypothetical protein